MTGRGDPGRYARNNLEWNRSVVHRLRFLAAAAEHEGITALEAHDTLSFARELHEQCVNLFLGCRVLRPAALTNVVKLRPSSCPRARREQRRIGERVVHDGISGVNELFPSYRDEARITGANGSGSAGVYGVRNGVALGLDQGQAGEAWGYDVAAQRVVWNRR